MRFYLQQSSFETFLQYFEKIFLQLIFCKKKKNALNLGISYFRSIDFTSTIIEKCLLQRDVLIKHNCVPTLSHHTRIMFAEHSINKFNVNNLIQDVHKLIHSRVISGLCSRALKK